MFLTHIQPLVAQHGYWFVFLIVMLESAGISAWRNQSSSGLYLCRSHRRA